MKHVFIIIILFTLQKGAKSQIVSTIAGNGLNVYSGDGGLALSAGIGYVGSIVFDNNGNYYFSQLNNTIRKVSTSGYISTVAGVGTAGYSGDGGNAILAELNFSGGGGMVFDRYNNLYIADESNNRIRKVDYVTGTISTYAGNGLAGFSGDGGLCSLASLNSPKDLAIDSNGNIYVLDALNYRIRRIDTNMIISTIAGTGTMGFSGDGGNAIFADIYTGGMINFGKNNCLYLSDGLRVRKIDLISGLIFTVAGNGIYGFSGDGGLAINAQFFSTMGITADKVGNIYISDRNNNRVRKVDTAGFIFTVIGNGTGAFSGDGSFAEFAQIFSPRGLVTDVCGNLLIVDNGNRRIRKVTMPPTLTIPTISLSVAEAGTVMPVGSIVTVNATVANAGSSYMIRWQNRGVEFATTTVPVVTYTKMPGVDTITARVVSTASYGCYDSTTSAPHYVSDSSTGVRGVGVKGGIYVYPNPANKQVTIMAGERIRSVAISNMQGQELLRYAPNATSYTVAIDMLPPGVYVVRVNDVWVSKVVKE
jgi:hypothetical protein